MALPAEISTCLMTATLLTDEGDPVEGSVFFTPSHDHVVSGPTNTVIELRRRSMVLDSTGSLAISFIASDEPDIRPMGLTWTMTVENTGTTLTFTVPLGLSTASIADYVIASPTPVLPEYLIGFRGPAGPPGSGFTWRGIWATGVTYNALDVVSSSGSTFLVLTSHVSSGSAPTPSVPGTRYALWAQAGDPSAGSVPLSRQVNSGTGLAGGGDLTVNRTLSVLYGSTSGTAVQGNDARVIADQTASIASIRTLGTGPEQAAPGLHTHPASQISDSSSVGRTVLTAATAAAARSALGVGTAQEGLVFWEENGSGTAWGTTRPTGFKRIKWSANGVTTSTDPALTLAVTGDIWERPV